MTASRRLAAVRHRVLAVDYREEKAPNGDLVHLGDVAVYDYDRDALLIVTVDGQTGEVVRVREAVGAPPITDDERAEALDLVARHSESAGAFTRSASSPRNRGRLTAARSSSSVSEYQLWERM